MANLWELYRDFRGKYGKTSDGDGSRILESQKN